MPLSFRRIARYLGLVWVLSWGASLPYAIWGGGTRSLAFLGVALWCMAVPGLVAIGLQRYVHNKPLSDLGLTWALNRWWTVALLTPLLVAGLATAGSALLPDAQLTGGLPTIHKQLEASSLPDDRVAAILSDLESQGLRFTMTLVLIYVVGSLIAGPTINALPALGEELGWRGYLWNELAPLGFWKASVATGVIWGVWHTPLVISGLNYPGYPLIGPLVMIAFCVAFSPIYTLIRVRTGTVLSAAAMHGVTNAAAGIPLVFVVGSNRLLTGTTGLVGILVLIAANVLIWLYLRESAHQTRPDVVPLSE